MPQKTQEAIAQCPNPKCRKPIRLDHLYSWCSECGDPLPESILSKLPKIQQLKVEAAIERDKLKASDAVPRPTAHAISQRIDEHINAVNGDYLVIPFIGKIKSGFFSSENAETVSRQLQSLINQYSHRGWELHNIAKVNIEVAPGCLASLFGATTSYITFDQVVFRRARP